MISKERVKELIAYNDMRITNLTGLNADLDLSERTTKIFDSHIEKLKDIDTILRSELERQGCEYCNEKNSKRIEAEIYKGDNITIEKYEDYCLDIEFWENDVKTTGLIKIQYCPMCGRKLGGE